MAELIAAYSPPIPAPAKNRNSAKLGKFQENAVAALAMKYTARVMKKSFLRPNRSVSHPNSNAPDTAPARYMLLTNPTSVLLKCRTGLCLSAPASDPASVTSSPSRIQVTPRAVTTNVWNEPHGSRSKRAGTSLSMISSTDRGVGAALAGCPSAAGAAVGDGESLVERSNDQTSENRPLPIASARLCPSLERGNAAPCHSFRPRRCSCPDRQVRLLAARNYD